MSDFSVGITGHMNISGATRRLVAQAIIGELTGIDQHLTGYTSLAPGADQIFTWALRAAGDDVIFVQPADNIESTIPADNMNDFQAARQICTTTIRMPFTTAGEPAYLQAGSWIADHTDLLLAVWDGRPAGGLGGTADIVERRRSSGRPLTLIWPDEATRDPS